MIGMGSFLHPTKKFISGNKFVVVAHLLFMCVSERWEST